MKRITVMSCYLKKAVILAIFLFVIFGGDKAFCKNTYIVTAQKPESGVTTQLYIYSNDEVEAAELVTLNGWKVLSVEKKPDEQSKIKESSPTEKDKEFRQQNIVNPTKNSNNSTYSNSGSALKIASNIEKISAFKSDYTQKNKPELIDNYSKNDYQLSLEKKILPKEHILKNINPVKLKYFGVVYFDFGAYKKVFTEDEIETFKSLDNVSNIIVYGHTDSVPVDPHSKSFRTNYELSLKRARFVKNAIANYTSAKNITIAGFGALMPKKDNTVNGEPLNRRVEIYGY